MDDAGREEAKMSERKDDPVERLDFLRGKLAAWDACIHHVEELLEDVNAAWEASWTLRSEPLMDVLIELKRSRETTASQILEVLKPARVPFPRRAIKTKSSSK